MSIFVPPIAVITVEWQNFSQMYIAFFALIDVYQNQIYHWNPETKLNQKKIKILNFKICPFLPFWPDIEDKS